MLAWIEGEDVKDVLYTLNNKEQYNLGVKAGKTLNKMHSIPAPENYIPWTTRFNRKIDRNINKYYACGIDIHGVDKILDKKSSATKCNRQINLLPRARVTRQRPKPS